MLRKAWVIGISAALAACVFGATAGFSEDTPPRLRGTLDQVNGNMLTIKTRSGTPTTVQLKDGAPVIATVKGAMSDIQDNSFVGITAMAQPDGTIKAVEVHVFAEPLRGIGEGHYPWDLTPDSTMTNAAVTQQVKKQDGNTLMLKYKDGEKTIVVPSDATVVNLIPGGQGGSGTRGKDIHPAVGEGSRWDLGSNSRARGPRRHHPTDVGVRANRALRHPAISLDQLAGAPGCFSGCARAKASIVESELAIRVKFENGAVSTEKYFAPAA